MSSVQENTTKLKVWLSSQGRKSFVAGDNLPENLLGSLLDLVKAHYISMGGQFTGAALFITAEDANAAMDWSDEMNVQSIQSEPVLKEVEILRVQPGDIVVFKSPSHIDMYTGGKLKEIMHQIFPDNQSMILGSGDSIEILRNENRYRTNDILVKVI